MTVRELFDRLKPFVNKSPDIEVVIEDCGDIIIPESMEVISLEADVSGNLVDVGVGNGDAAQYLLIL